ncbi:Super Killer 7, Hsp70 subfamily B Suppressor 1 [Hibiscus trionum]|uniref:Super Killer 7, Hsp70 subfamily B Suppressor 1 n=1 Tax=Hibiscus trionum TaxID=183268 RepID=A0A9W7I9M8_HIBTR|nr:Super Killer 7, Hsp70 subfamily B Suppressor 1 [Hibiscus trionum]
MPRKVSYGIDYVDEYDDYDDYDDYDYGIGYDAEENVKEPSEQDTIRHGVWRCSICTYDNDNTMSSCDICGALRSPSVSKSTYDEKKTVPGICKVSGVSVMAKSLFASSPHQMSKKFVDSQQQNDDFGLKEGNNFHMLGNNQGQFHEFHEAYSSPTHYRFNIAPFKFDIPSPDDVVSNGLHSSKLHPKAQNFGLKSSKAPSSVVGKNKAVKRSDNSYDSTGKDKHDEIIFPENLEINAPLGSRTSASVPKGRLENPDESSIGVNMCSSGPSSSLLMRKERTDMMDDSSSSRHGGEAHTLASNLKNMTLASESGNPKDISRGKANSRAQYKPEKWMLPVKAEDSLTQLNLAIVGHVDSGKSTLSGRLLHLLGRISQKEMHKYEKDSRLQGKGSFAYAWALDESAEERERGITMTVAVAYFDSKRYHVVVLDSPGHKDFVPNMITGAAQADAVILVIDASIGSFEVGMDGTKGQTREHAQLIRSFGVDQIIVAVNKMDAVDYSKDRFDFIKSQLGTFLRSCGFKDSSVSWIPLSAADNQNLVATPSDVRLSWYQGPYLLDAIDSFQPSIRDFSKPLLLPICDVIKSSQGQVSVCGKLEAGAVRSGSKVLVMPSADIATVRSLERDSQACSIARAGDNVTINLHGIDGNHVMAGGVLCHPDFPVAFAKHLELRVLVLDGATPILTGSQLEFYVHHAKEAARVARISSLLDSKTGKVAKKAPRCIVAKQSAIVEVVLQEPVCIEEFSKCKALGRVFLRTLGRTVAVGIVTRIVEEQQ